MRDVVVKDSSQVNSDELASEVLSFLGLHFLLVLDPTRCFVGELLCEGDRR